MLNIKELTVNMKIVKTSITNKNIIQPLDTFKIEILQSKDIISSWLWTTALSILTFQNYATMFPRIMRTDENFNIIWSALFDISNGFIDTPKTLTEDNTVYIATLNNLNYGCIMTLSFEAGTHILSKCYQYLPALNLEYNDNSNQINDLISFNETYFIIDITNSYTGYSLLAFGNLFNWILTKVLLYSFENKFTNKKDV